MRTTRIQMYHANFRTTFQMMMAEMPWIDRAELLATVAMMFATLLYLVNHSIYTVGVYMYAIVALLFIIVSIRYAKTINVGYESIVKNIEGQDKNKYEVVQRDNFYKNTPLKEHTPEDIRHDVTYLEDKAINPWKYILTGAASIYTALIGFLYFANKHFFGQADEYVKLQGFKWSAFVIVMVAMILAMIFPFVYNYLQDRRTRNLRIAKWLYEWVQNSEKK